ncbi:MAG: Hpt domain-containing protein [Gammaproteobacteria bacterium]|nr:Hpt domain-containing protein [Gammaproteobacteria bacterium]
MSEVINQDTIAMLKDVLGSGFGEVVDAFLGDTPVRLQKAQVCAANGDLAGLEREIHAVKGSSGNVGATLVCQLATAIVDGCRQRSLTAPNEAVIQLIAAFEQTAPLLDALKSP